MAKYYSTAAYRAADALNKQLKNIYNEWGPDSEIYEMYVNKLTGTLPAGSLHVSAGGFMQVSKAKGAVTAQQIKKAKRGLPSKQQAATTYRRQVAEEKLAQQGNKLPTESQIQRQAKQVTKEDIQRYVDDKSYVKDKEDAKGKLIYSDSVADLMSTAGAKSYSLLRAILEEGEARDAKTSQETANADAVESSYQNGKAALDS